LIEKKAYDSVMFTPSGPAGAFALYAPAGVNLGYVFMNEFIVVSHSMIKTTKL
jgi:hypothetical protein